MLKLLAFDYGASSGRAIIGFYDGSKMELNEVHRFSNDPIMVNGSLYWNVLGLFHEMKRGMQKCVKNGNRDISGIGVDTWGVDFGLLDANGDLLGNPYHYRDLRTEGMIELAASRMPKDEIYKTTGIAFLKFNTLYQLLSMKEGNSPILEKAKTMLFMPDLLNYFLTGVKSTEYTIASTSQMLSAQTRSWANDMLSRIGISCDILTGIVTPGVLIGDVREDVAGESGVGRVPVIAVAEHDTGSAVVSVPAGTGRYAYISSGTWSLMGVESDVPVINDDTYRLNYTNEGGAADTIRLLKNIMGLWICQECKRHWDKTDEVLGFDTLELLAGESEPFKCFIDPDDDMFYSPGRMPGKVAEYCMKTGQYVPRTKGEIMRCIMESLALKYREAVEGLEKIVGYDLPVIHVVGGGSKNTMLNRFTANSTGKRVIAGPVEATATGNLAMQLLALGEVSDISEARTIVRNSFPMQEYMPSEREEWDEAYGRYLNKVRGHIML